MNRSTRSIRWLMLIASLAFVSPASAHSAKPLALHPHNPHYFLFRGKPTVLITSGEHYGAVLNLDFDYLKYLDTLAKDGLNLTRTFSGLYVEPYDAFNIASNTLAPAPNRFICPWARSDTPGYTNGGGKFDLTRWDGAYFRRLKDFVTQAGRRGIIVELNLFCPMYEESQWRLSPQNALNNINGIGDVARTNVYTLDRNGGLLAVQEAMVRKILTELRGFDNVYYEICNEPYFGGVTMEWQHHIADVILETERGLLHQGSETPTPEPTKRGNRPSKHRGRLPSAAVGGEFDATEGCHLISQNIANNKAKIEHPHPAVSIFNFHYASPPDTVPMNHGLDKVIGDNETGFHGTNDLPYRIEAWSFILAGGGLFNHLDYSFVVGREDGTFVYPATQPGGGNAAFRGQMNVLKKFINSFDFVKMKPLDSAVVSGLAEGARAYILAETNQAYAIYLAPSLERRDRKVARTNTATDSNGNNQSPFGEARTPHAWVISLALPEGRYRAEWVNPLTGGIDQRATATSRNGRLALTSPPCREDIALKLTKK